jgi:hypothetical protein
MDQSFFRLFDPNLPRSLGVPSASQSTVCSPFTFPGGKPWVAQVPEEPTAWPRSLSPNAYEDFFKLWKDADPGIAVLKQAQAEYLKLD